MTHEAEVYNMLFQEFTYKDIAEVRYDEGREEGIEKGRTVGREEGREEGIEVGYKNVAIKMIKANKPDFEILEMTELSLSEIQKLRELYV